MVTCLLLFLNPQGILGYVVFGEVSGLWWWFGISLIVTGILVMNNSDLESERRKD